MLVVSLYCRLTLLFIWIFVNPKKCNKIKKHGLVHLRDMFKLCYLYFCLVLNCQSLFLTLSHCFDGNHCARHTLFQ